MGIEEVRTAPRAPWHNTSFDEIAFSAPHCDRLPNRSVDQSAHSSDCVQAQ
jgi:hypothetical protein